jgi:retron-type reverse transcriptase
MRRTGGLWDRLTSFENVELALGRAAAGKRGRPDVAAVLLQREETIVRIRRELLSGGYWPSPYRTFLVRAPKHRKISAAPFRDRVVHHAFTQVVEPVFEPRFSNHSYACRTGFGTHRALEACARAAAAYPYVLQCDIRKYFPSIDHAILKGQLERTVKCGPTLELAGRIIDGSNDQEEHLAYFPGDDLFTPFERRRGLPLGNQTSQFFANVYLDPLDQLVERTLRPRAYLRYCDDFVLFHEDKRFLADALQAMVPKLDGLRLRLHAGKTRAYRTGDGVTFLGWRVFPDRKRLVRGNVVRFRRRLRDLERDYAAGRIGWEDVKVSVESWIAHARHGDTWRLREEIFAVQRFESRPGFGVARRFGKELF